MKRTNFKIWDKDMCSGTVNAHSLIILQNITFTETISLQCNFIQFFGQGSTHCTHLISVLGGPEAFRIPFRDSNITQVTPLVKLCMQAKFQVSRSLGKRVWQYIGTYTHTIFRV